MKVMNWLRDWLYRRHMRKNCFHHNYHDARGGSASESWMREQKIDGGRKLYWCIYCKKSWIL